MSGVDAPTTTDPASDNADPAGPVVPIGRSRVGPSSGTHARRIVWNWNSR